MSLGRQAQSESDLPLRGGGGAATSVDCGVLVIRWLASALLSGAHGCVDFAGDVAVGVASPAVIDGDVAIRVAPLAVAGVASPAVAGARPRSLLGWRPWPLLGWHPWPTLLGVSLYERHPWSMLGWRPWPMLGWRPWPTWLAVLPTE